MANQVYNDPYKAAMNPQVRSGFATDLFGQIMFDLYECILAKGAGKIPFDPNQHKEEQKRIAIKMEVIPLAEMNISWSEKRELIAENREWAGIVLPSIIKVFSNPGSLSEVNLKWVHIFRKETGETFISKKDGKTYPVTTFEFVQVFKDEAECRAAYQAFAAGAGSQPAAQPVPAAAAPASTPANGNGNGMTKEKETAFKFLKVIVDNAARGQKDMNVIMTTVAMNISNMAPVAKFYTVDSPETMELIVGAMSNGH